MPDDIGPVRGVTDATRAVSGHLQLWLPLYLNRVGGHLGVELRVPRTWHTPVAADGVVADGQLPAVSVVPAGTASVRRNGAVWEAAWLLDVVIFARAGSYDRTAELLGGYMTAAHLALAQHRGVGDLDDCQWVGELIEQIDPTANRSLGQATVTVSAKYDRVVDETAYPSNVPDPISDPVDGWPTVTSTHVPVDQTVP